MEILQNLSAECIVRYLQKHNVFIKQFFTRIQGTGRRKEIVETLHLYCFDDKSESLKNKRCQVRPIMTFHYSIADRVFHISTAYTTDKQNKPNLANGVKLFEIFLLYILINHADLPIHTVTLDAIPQQIHDVEQKDEEKHERNKKGVQYCLLCFYEKLGFQPVEQRVLKETKTRIKTCIRQRQRKDKGYKQGYEHDEMERNHIKQKNKKDMCFLCNCQKDPQNIQIDDEDSLRLLQVEMSVLLPNLFDAIVATASQIFQEC